MHADFCILRTDARRADRQRRADRRHDGRGGRGAPPRADPRHADHARQGEGRGRGQGKEKAGKLGKKVTAKNLAVFTRQFSVMIDAGLPLVQCLDILGSQEEDKNFAAVILQTRTDVESGASLADAMRKHPKTFDPLFTNMIAAGEAGGILDTILKRLATYIEKAVKLTGQVKSAMIYPIAVIVIAGVVVGVILWKVIPTFAQLFAGLGAELPLPTRIVIWLSNTLVAYFPLARSWSSASPAIAFRSYYTTAGRPARRRRHAAEAAGPRQHPAQDRRRAVLPDAGDAHQLRRADSRRPRDHRQDLRQRDRRGRRHGRRARASSAARRFRRRSRRPAVFPSMVTQMIGVGEATGALDTMLAKIADFYEEEVDTAVAGLLTLLEPIMIAVLGVIVGGIVIAMYLPIFDLISKLT